MWCAHNVYRRHEDVWCNKKWIKKILECDGWSEHHSNLNTRCWREWIPVVLTHGIIHILVWKGIREPMCDFHHSWKEALWAYVYENEKWFMWLYCIPQKWISELSLTKSSTYVLCFTLADIFSSAVVILDNM